MTPANTPPAVPAAAPDIGKMVEAIANEVLDPGAYHEECFQQERAEIKAACLKHLTAHLSALQARAEAAEKVIDHDLLPLILFPDVDPSVLTYARSQPFPERVAEIAQWMLSQKQTTRDYVALREKHEATESSLATARQELDAARVEVEKLKDCNKILHDTAKADFTSLRATVATLREKLRDAQASNMSYRLQVKHVQAERDALQSTHAGGDTLTKLETEMRSIKDSANECASSNPPDSYEALEPGSDALRLADACFQHGMDSMETALSNWIYDQRNAALPADTKNTEGDART